jgi:hypothetical protein
MLRKPSYYVGSVQENGMHLRNALLYTLRLILAYQLMLAIMTFNIGVSIAVFTGAFIGHFLFARLGMVGANQHTEEENIGCH